MQSSANQDVITRLRELFPDKGDYIERIQFPKLHEIILGIGVRSNDLATELALCRSNVNEVDSRGRTAIAWATLRGDYWAVNLLLRSRADPNICDEESKSPLLFACTCASIECIKLLLVANANPRQISLAGDNALYYYIFCGGDSREAIKLIIAAGANPNLPNLWENTPLFAATVNNNAPAASALLDLGAEINFKDRVGSTALFNSITHASDDILELLLQRGADYTSYTLQGNSILHQTVISGGF